MNLDLRLMIELEKALGERMEQHAAELVSGKASDFADYRHRAGRLQGLRDALVLAKEANNRLIGQDRKE